jgi:hypothetical protein
MYFKICFRIKGEGQACLSRSLYPKKEKPKAGAKICRTAEHVGHIYNASTQDAEAEGYELKASLGYIVRPCLKTKLLKQCHKKVQTTVGGGCKPVHMIFMELIIIKD